MDKFTNRTLFIEVDGIIESHFLLDFTAIRADNLTRGVVRRELPVTHCFAERGDTFSFLLYRLVLSIL